MMLGSLRFGGSPQVPQGPGQNGQGTTTAAGPGVNAGTQTVLRTSGSSLGPSGSSFLWDSIRHGLGSFAGGSNVVAPMLVPQAAQKHLHSVIPGPAGGAVGTVPPSGVLPSYAPRAVASTAPSSSLPVIGPLPAPNASQGQFMPLVVVDYAPSTAAHPAVDVSTPGSLQAPKDIFDDPRSRHSSGSMSIDGEPSGIGRSPEGSLANPPMSFGAVPSQLAPLHVPLYYSSTSLPTVAFSGYGTPQFIAAPGSSAAPPSVAAYHPGQQPAFQYHIAGTRQSSGLNQLHFAAAGNPYMQLHYAHQPSLAHMPAAVLPIVLPHGQQMSAQDLAMLQHFLAQPNFGHPGVVGPPPFPYEAQRQASSGQLVAGHSGSILGANYVHASPASVNEHVIETVLQNAHAKYNSGDYQGALALLQELYALAPKKLPVLLLMGCTYYSLGMHHLSVLYNEEILAIDSGFAEAYSNLGTTFRALAQGQQSSIASWGQLVLATSRGYCSSLLPHGQPITQKDFYTIAERFYRQGLAIRPRYWDAAINLAGLLSAQGRYQEALDVYISLEMAVEKTAEANERFGNKEIHVAGEGGDRAYVFGLQTAEKSRLERLATKHAAKRPHKEGKPGWDNRESRKDLYYAKGNLSYVLSNVAAAKKEYLKALVVAGYDVASVLASCHSGVMPNPPVTPAQVVVDIANKKEPPISTTKPGSGSGSGGVAATSLMMQTLAKIYQDSGMTHFAVAFYYLSLSLHPVANSCNNLGILLSAHRLDEAIAWYEVGLKLDPNHPHVLTNLGSALKDRGLIAEGINCYKRAIQIQPDFYIALANLANVYKDQGKVDEAIGLYRRALTCKPDFVEAFCNYVNSLLFVCDWAERDENLARISLVVKEQLKAARRSNPVGIPTVLPFHTFTYSTLSAYQVREISRLNAERILWNVTSAPWFRGFPQRPAKITSHALAALPAASQNLETWSAFRNELQRFVSTAFHYPLPQPLPPAKDARLAIGYVSSDFKDHPLSHLMQSVFGMHDRSRFRVVCYALLPPDDSVYAKKIASECESFVDVSRMSIEETVDQIGRDGIQVLVNLNGYTKGGRNEIFAARPAPISMQFMGFAGTMGAGPVLDEVEEMGESGLDVIDGIDGDPDVAFFDTMRDRWIDYFVADEVALPRRTVVGEPRDVEFEQISNGASAPPGPDHKRRKATDSNRVYTENVVYLPNSYFVNDHRQGFRDLPDEEADAIMPGIGRAWVASGGRLEDGVSLPEDQWKAWTREQYLRTKMRQDLFPGIKEDTIVFANMNQSYKIDPQIFEVWLNILRRVPNSILWLLRFPPAAEKHLHGWAVAKAGEEVASRVVFTDVAPKHLHIHRGRIADLFLDTPECNAHTTAADILWSGTPLLTLPKYEFKMCSRVAASVAYATGKWNGEEGAGMRRELAMLGSEAAQRDVDAKAAMIAKVKAKFATGTTDLDWWSRAKAAKELRGGRGSRTEKLQDPDLLGHLMVAGSYKEYEDRAVRFGLGMRWIWKDISGVGTFSPPVGHTGPFFPNRESPTHILTPIGPLVTLRRRLFLTRDRMPLFDTARWVRDVEEGMLLCWERFEEGWAKVTKRNMEELVPLQKIGLDLPLATTGAAGTSNVPTAPLLRSRCLWIDDDDDDQTPSHL